MPSSETARNAASSSTAPMPSNAHTERRPRRPAAKDVILSLPEQDRLGPMLSEVARYAEKRELDYEAKIESLNNAFSNLRRRELKWSLIAKMYKQDRSYMHLRLAQLERDIMHKMGMEGGQPGAQEGEQHRANEHKKQSSASNTDLMMVFETIIKMVDDFQVHFGPVKVTRLPAEDSDASQRTEMTRQNTLYNQYNNQFHVDATYRAATSNSYPGTGSRLEPHVLDDDNDHDHDNEDDNNDDNDDNVTPVSDTDESPGGDTKTRAMSPSLPSELELRRRQALAESESEEDIKLIEEQANEMPEKVVRHGRTNPESTSPTVRTLRKHRQTPAGATGSTLGGDGAHRITDNQTVNHERETTKLYPDFSLPSDHSSPPMFDFTDYNDTDHTRRNTNVDPRSPTGASDSESYDESDDNLHPPPRPQFTPTAPAKNSEKGSLIVEDTPQELQETKLRSLLGKHPAEDGAVTQDQSSKRGHRRRKEEWITSTKPRHSRQSIHPRQEEYEFLTEGDGGPSANRGPVFNETERRKDKRKHMHASDCACCRRFYQLTGPLPLPDGYNSFFTPAPRPGQPEVWEQTPQQRLNQRIQTVSRHRVQYVAPATPPGYWDTDFPATPDRQEWDRIALERKNRKKQRLEQEAEPSSSRK
ncbi:hypothetical protein BG003_004897 [Podila horticola]|nr:hypothetical protein BG003_004897 [Podila horticola]